MKSRTSAVIPRPAVSPALYAQLDGLRAFIAAALAGGRDDRLTLEWAQAELTALCHDAPAWCPGCVDRGTGLVCCICGAPVPAVLRRRPGAPSEIRVAV